MGFLLFELVDYCWLVFFVVVGGLEIVEVLLVLVVVVVGGGLSLGEVGCCEFEEGCI